MFNLGYYLHESGNYHVTWHQTGQTISFSPRYFRKAVVMRGSVIAASVEVDLRVLLSLGFEIPAIAAVTA